MEYQLTQTGEQVQQILDQAPTTEQNLQSEIERSTTKDQELETAIGNEKTRAEGVEGPLVTAVGNLETDVEAIKGVIPAQATPSNKLVDKNYVDDAIATNTADFKGTYPSLEALITAVPEANANDYAFVVTTDQDGNVTYSRYKYVEGTGWTFEYALNNSSFTAAQWAAINSGITAALVAKLAGLPNADTLVTQMNALIAVEKNRAEAAEGTLTNGLNAEILARQNADTTLQQNINAEALLRDNADDALQAEIDGIDAKIPTQASASNQLADKAFVNSSIATNTGEFKGTYDSLAQLEAVSANNNDYGYVRNEDSVGNVVYSRYKYVTGTGWVFEYNLNNSSFTAAQWAAINSGITAALAAKINGLPDIDALNAMFAAITSKIPADASSSNKLVDYAQLVAALSTKQDTLIFDNVPTEGSNNPVKSGGVYNRLYELTVAIVGLQSSKQDVLTFDQYPTPGSNNPVRSGGINTWVGNQLEPIDIRISTNEADIAMLQAAYRALTESDVVVVGQSDTWPVANPQLNTIYRVSDRAHTPPQNYSDYMYNGTAMVLMATYDNAIDDVPTSGSNNLVKSGGVFNELALGAVYDVTAHNSGATFASLEALLTDANLNNLIPTAVRNGGMIIKFVCSSDNKYVQYRLMLSTFTNAQFANAANWQGVDDKPTPTSENLVESGGVFNTIGEASSFIFDNPCVDTSVYTDILESVYPYTIGALKLDGTINSDIDYYKTYTINNNFDDSIDGQLSLVCIYGHFQGAEKLSRYYINVEATDVNGNIVYRGRIEGYRMIVVYPGWSIRISGNVNTVLPNIYVYSGTNAYRDFVYYITHNNDIQNYIQSNIQSFVDTEYNGLIRRSWNSHFITPVDDYLIPTTVYGNKDTLPYVEGLYFHGSDPEGSPSYSTTRRTYKITTASTVQNPPKLLLFKAASYWEESTFRDICVTDSSGKIVFEQSLLSGQKYAMHLTDKYTYYITCTELYVTDSDFDYKVINKQTVFVTQASDDVPLDYTSEIVPSQGGYYKMGEKTVPTGTYAWYISYTNSDSNLDVKVYISGFKMIADTGGYKVLTLLDSKGNIAYEGNPGYGAFYITVPSGYTLIAALRNEYSKAFIVSTTQASRTSFKRITCIGDSLTYADKFQSKLRQLLATNLYIRNAGIGGEGVGTIFGRVNSIPFKLNGDIIIPADNATPVQVYLKNDFGCFLAPLMLTYHSCDCTIATIDGVLTTDGTHPSEPTANYYFTRKTSGTQTTVKDGEEIIINDDNSYFGAPMPNDYQIIWVGENGDFKYGGASAKWQPTIDIRNPSADTATQADFDNLMEMIKMHINATCPCKYLVLSPPRGTSDAMEATFSKVFGGAYVNVRMEMVNNGINIALAKGYLEGSYPTAEDLDDISNGIVPTSLRSDYTHFNDAGYYTLAEILKVKINNLWGVI